MALRRRKRQCQQGLWIATNEFENTPRSRFYDALNRLLAEGDFDRVIEDACAPHYQPEHTPGRPSIPPGVFFRMLLVGYFEGIESERGICWRCSDSLSLRSFLGLSLTDRTPDHSSLSRIRWRLPASVFAGVFDLILKIVADNGLLSGRVAGIDSTYSRADSDDGCGGTSGGPDPRADRRFGCPSGDSSARPEEPSRMRPNGRS